VARWRLREGTTLNLRLALHFAQGQISIRFADGETFTTRAGRTERRTNRDGELMRVTQRLLPTGQLEQIFATDGGTRRYLWTPAANGDVTLAISTTSPRLPQPMLFSLRYVRPP
jgi:hypothetical protein